MTVKRRSDRAVERGERWREPDRNQRSAAAIRNGTPCSWADMEAMGLDPLTGERAERVDTAAALSRLRAAVVEALDAAGVTLDAAGLERFVAELADRLIVGGEVTT